MAELPHARGHPMAKNKNQHYVSAFYLYGFTSEEQRRSLVGRHWRKTPIFHYDIALGRMMERPLDKVAIEPYMFSFLNADGSINHQLDGVLKTVEDRASRAIKEICRIVKYALKKKPPAISIQNAHIDALLNFLYWQFKRNPVLVSEMQREIERSLKGIHAPSIKPKQLALEILDKMGSSGEYDIRSEFQKKNKVFLCISRPDAHFVTTDKPFVRFNKTTGNGIAMPGTEMYFPITPKILLLMCGNGNGKMFRLFNNRKHLKALNTYLARSASGYVFGPSEAYLQSIVRGINYSDRPAIPKDNFSEAVSRIL